MPLPEGCVHLNIKRAKIASKSLGIDYVEAVVGFEKSTNGRSHPTIAGVVIQE
jgi:hypothetical protein